MTDDPDFRLATSILDYVFRRLALQYLESGERHALGIRTSGERQSEIEGKLDSPEPSQGNGNGHPKPEGSGAAEAGGGVIVLGPVADARTDSLPMCGTCGTLMQPAGSCFVCTACGSTSGCS
ncbi:MAG: hypothetical protein H0T12_03420 [Actinobacteria bacterium]|nr:hypothetical protein [Actinomycetota bacterium]